MAWSTNAHGQPWAKRSCLEWGLARCSIRPWLLQGVTSGAKSKPPLAHLRMCKNHLQRGMRMCRQERHPPPPVLSQTTPIPHLWRTNARRGEKRRGSGWGWGFASRWPVIWKRLKSFTHEVRSEQSLLVKWRNPKLRGKAGLFHNLEGHSQAILKLQFMFLNCNLTVHQNSEALPPHTLPDDANKGTQVNSLILLFGLHNNKIPLVVYFLIEHVVMFLE